MVGYMTLLEAWIYEHFRPFRPHQNMEYTVQLPHVHGWTPCWEAGLTISHLQALREELDRLAFDEFSHYMSLIKISFEFLSEVTWDPYRDCRQYHLCHEIIFYTGCLKCLDVVEPYHPEKVLKQFGRVQTIPPTPLDPVLVVRGVTAGRYRVMYQYLYQIWESWDNHVLSARMRNTPIRHPADCRIDHTLRIAHPIIEAGHDASVREPDRLYEAIERMSHVLQGQQIDEARLSSIPFRAYNRRRQVDNR
ncbi:hypothetical protein ACSBR1_013052 [Camellia fascicularis]